MALWVSLMHTILVRRVGRGAGGESGTAAIADSPELAQPGAAVVDWKSSNYLGCGDDRPTAWFK